MKLVMWKAPKGYENALGPAIIAGAEANGDEIVVKSTEEYRGPEYDGGLIMGIVKREILWDHQAKGIPLAYYDKGFHRSRMQWHGQSLPAWWRMCWNAVHPTAYMMDAVRPSDRWEMLGVQLQRRQRHPLEKTMCEPIVILGSSAKFHETMRIEHPTPWAQDIVRQLALKTKRPVTLRPKPSWADAEPVLGAGFDHGQKTAVEDALRNAWCSITYGSISCVDSIIAGIPCVVLGNGVASPISSNIVQDALNPLWADLPAREQWAANLTYHHFTPDEIASGVAWKIMKENLSHAV